MTLFGIPLFPILLVTHITLAISLFIPSLVLPFAYRPARLRRGQPSDRPSTPGPVVRFLLRLQSTGSLVIGGGLALTGLGLVTVLGIRLLEQPWLLVALSIYALTMAIAYFVQRPSIRIVLGLAALTDEVVAARAKRARYVSYLMGGFIGTIGVLMSSKPHLW